MVVLDECGHFAVPILSGHLGGANDLARALAAVCGAVPVITTATDANGVFAVDAWARHQNCAVLEPGRIKRVSSRLLASGPVRYRSEFPIAGQAPAGVVPAGEAERADFALTLFPAGDALHLIPKIGVLGIGCRRGTSAAQLEAAFAQFCAAHGLAAACITAAASIDLKAHEPGLLEFCRIHGWPVQFYSAAQLQNAPRAVHTFGLCPERDRCGQCLRAGGGAGGRRHDHSSQTGGQRRDLCAGASSLCPGLEVAGCLMLFLLSGLGPGIPGF